MINTSKRAGTDDVRRRPIVGVMGSGRELPNFADHAAALGRLIAESGAHLLTGGGEGVMRDVAQGFSAVEGRRGLSLGVIPALAPDNPVPPRGYPNEFVELPIFTHLGRSTDPDDPTSRNPINVLTADRMIFCPGNAGTLSELVLAKRLGRPRILYLPGGATIDGLSAGDLADYGTATGDIEDVRAFLLGS